MIPNDVQYASLDIGVGASWNNILLASSTIDRTIVYANLTSDDSDAHIDIIDETNTTSTPYIDAEGADFVESFNQVKLPAGYSVTCDKDQTNKKVFYDCH